MSQKTKLITIVTPTYNRCGELKNLFCSLQRQVCDNFVWLIVDDGSEDNTSAVVDSFKSDLFDIIYVRKENGGKHTALNLAFKLVNTELTFIVDSDDVLTSDATKIIEQDWSQYRDNNLCGISYLRGYSEKEVIGDEHSKDFGIGNFITERFNKNIGGDKAEVWRTDLLKKYPYPEFDGEKFLGESWLWIKLAHSFDMLLRNKIIYVTQYLDGGLSKSGRALRVKCPYGGMLNAEIMMNHKFSLKQRLKGSILYCCYAFFTNKRIYNLRKNPHKVLVLITLFPGFVLFMRWKRFLK